MRDTNRHFGTSRRQRGLRRHHSQSELLTSDQSVQTTMQTRKWEMARSLISVIGQCRQLILAVMFARFLALFCLPGSTNELQVLKPFVLVLKWRWHVKTLVKEIRCLKIFSPHRMIVKKKTHIIKWLYFVNGKLYY